MQTNDMMVLGVAAVAVYLITRKGGIKFSMPAPGRTTSIPAHIQYLPDATGLTPAAGSTDWVVPGSQQADMLAAQW